jgi:putative ABC transport system permease protein
MIGIHARMALASINALRWRSFLTMLGVIIGVLSVVTIVSLGEGVKQQLTNQVHKSGSNLITVRGGHIASRNPNGQIKKVNLLNLLAGTNMTDADVQTIQKMPNMQLVSPFAIVTGVPESDEGVKDENATIVATNSQGADALSQDVVYGGFFTESNNHSPVAVIGKKVAERLFRANVPVGRSFELRGQKFTVNGIFQEFDANPLTPGIDYNQAIFVPYEYIKQLGGINLAPYQILVKPTDAQTPQAAASAITDGLKTAHGGQSDFTVLLSSDNIILANSVITLLTNLVTAIASISLLVGGIGIMNIMLVAVSERTHEIGVRKSLGATNRQILSQFLTEAVVLSTVGGFFGVILSLVANYFLRLLTNLQPVITWPIMAIAVGVAIGVGTIFGMMPAIKAARKDPIEALRRI